MSRKKNELHRTPPNVTEQDQRALELTRRDVLRLGAGAAILLPLGLGGCDRAGDLQDEGICDLDPAPLDAAVPLDHDLEAVPQDDEVFDLGVQSGAVAQTSALLWTHVTDGEPKLLRVWRDGEEGAKLLATEFAVQPHDGYIKATVESLAPGMTYRYAFFTRDGERRSLVGRFRTAHPDGCRRPVTFGATSCTAFRHAPFKAIQLASEFEMDAFCHLGDMAYNDGAETREEFRAGWRKTLLEPGYRALLANTSLYMTWDDHEIVNDDQLYNLDEAIRRQGIEAYFETLPVPRLGGDRFWQSYRWGESVEVFVLDCRGERKPETRLTEEAIYISRAQMDWLKKGLAESRAHFKVILNSVPISAFPIPPWFLENDRWQGYPAQRRELLDFIANEQIPNVWWLSGDFHVGAVMRVETEGPLRNNYEILVGPGANLNPIAVVVEHDPDSKEIFTPVDQFRFFSGRFAATLLTFDPLSDSVHVKFVDAESREVLYEQTLSQRE